MPIKHDWATDKAIDLIVYAARYQHSMAVEMIAMELRMVFNEGEVKALRDVLPAEALA
jgi:hypothetical protein